MISIILFEGSYDGYDTFENSYDPLSKKVGGMPTGESALFLENMIKWTWTGFLVAASSLDEPSIA